MTGTPPTKAGTSEQGGGVESSLARPRPGYGLGRIALHLAALTGLVVAQPVYSVYQASPDIFVARSTPPLALVILAAGLAVIPPLALTAMVALIGWIRPAWRMYIASLLVGILVFGLAVQAGWKLDGVHPALPIGAAALVGGAGAILYLRRAAAGTYLTLLSPAPLIFLGLFLLTPPLVALTVPRSINIHGLELSSDASVVFIVFDEFPQVSLLNSDLEIDRERYPNFAELVDDSTWFRNAAPAYPFTTRSMSALLSGLLPDSTRLSTAADLPNNIFTLFGRTHTLHVEEPLTDLCPESLCPSERVPVWNEIGEMSRITAQVYQRILAPHLFDDDVLQLDDPFERGDRINAGLKENRLQAFRDFALQVDGSQRQFYFGHFLVPHGPFHYLPSGKSYNRTSQSDPGLSEDGFWSGDPWHTLDNQQRHLLQVSAVDRLIGELVGHLKEIDAYEETMIVITSDHGVAHIPGQPRRSVSSENLYDVGLVPLIIKEPHQSEGVLDDRLIQAVDVIPTVADMLGADRPWPGDGEAISTSDGRAQLVMLDNEFHEVSIDVEGPGRAEAVQRVIERFGESGKENDLFAYGPFADLVGSSVRSLAPDEAVLTAIIDEPTLYSYVEPGSGFVPAYVSGEVDNLSELPLEPHIALAVNGIVGGVVPLHNIDGDTAQFGGVVSDSLFRNGANPVSLLSLYSMNGETTMNQIATNIAPSYSLIGSPVSALESSTGARIEIDPEAVVGFVDSAIPANGQRVLTGWAIDGQSLSPVDAVVVFIDGEFAVSLVPNAERAGLAEQMGSQEVLMSGFAVRIPESLFGEDFSRLSVYGVSPAGASELGIVDAVRQDLGMTE